MKRPSDFLVNTQGIRIRSLVGAPFFDASSNTALRTQCCTSVDFPHDVPSIPRSYDGASPCVATARASFLKFRSNDTWTLRPPSMSGGCEIIDGVDVARLRNSCPCPAMPQRATTRCFLIVDETCVGLSVVFEILWSWSVGEMCRCEESKSGFQDEYVSSCPSSPRKFRIGRAG